MIFSSSHLIMRFLWHRRPLLSALPHCSRYTLAIAVVVSMKDKEKGWQRNRQILSKYARHSTPSTSTKNFLPSTTHQCTVVQQARRQPERMTQRKLLLLSPPPQFLPWLLNRVITIHYPTVTKTKYLPISNCHRVRWELRFPNDDVDERQRPSRHIMVPNGSKTKCSCVWREFLSF